MDKLNLAEETKRLNRSIMQLVRQQSVARSFLRGVAAGLGSVVGATIVVGILALILRNVSLIPLIGDWLAQIVEYVMTVTSK